MKIAVCISMIVTLFLSAYVAVFVVITLFYHEEAYVGADIKSAVKAYGSKVYSSNGGYAVRTIVFETRFRYNIFYPLIYITRNNTEYEYTYKIQ